MFDTKTRAYIYRIIVAISVVAGIYGLATDVEIVGWLGIANAILGGSLASVNTSTKSEALDQ